MSEWPRKNIATFAGWDFYFHRRAVWRETRFPSHTLPMPPKEPPHDPTREEPSLMFAVGQGLNHDTPPQT